MPFVSSNGEITQKQPWSISKVVGIFWGILNFIFIFFQTLINPGSHSRGNQYSQDFRGPGGGTVGRVTSSSDLEAQLRQAGTKLVVIDFFATWCGPCKMIAPYIEEMASSYPDVLFLKVDVDECFDVASEYQVTVMPTIVFIKNGRKLTSFAGANIDSLRSTVQRYR